jgi:chemotaxis protein CheD
MTAETAQMRDLKQHFLFPCMIFCDRDECLVSTVLGSCVSVCLYEPVMRAGGINHFMLPFWNGEGLASPKFGNIAVARLIADMESLGCRAAQLKAKVFGGAKVLSAKINSELNVGERNIQSAMDALNRAGIPVAAASVGEDYGRKIIFNTATGEILLKRISRIDEK